MDNTKSNIEKGIIILEKAGKKFNSTIDPLNCCRFKIINYLKPKKVNKNPDYWDTWRSGHSWITRLSY